MSDGGYKTMEKAFFEAQDEIDRLKNELKEAHVATDFANLACDRKDAEIVRLKEKHAQMADHLSQLVVDLQLHKQQLATYKAAVVEGGALLKECSDRLVTCQHTAYSYETKCCIDKCRQHLHTLSALTGDATRLIT